MLLPAIVYHRDIWHHSRVLGGMRCDDVVGLETEASHQSLPLLQDYTLVSLAPGCDSKTGGVCGVCGRQGPLRPSSKPPSMGRSCFWAFCYPVSQSHALAGIA